MVDSQEIEVEDTEGNWACWLISSSGIAAETAKHDPALTARPFPPLIGLDIIAAIALATLGHSVAGCYLTPSAKPCSQRLAMFNLVPLLSRMHRSHVRDVGKYAGFFPVM